MNYVWETVIQADREGIPRDHLRFEPTRYGSPYTEVSSEIINRSTLGGGTVQVNPLYRFSNVFSQIFDLNLEDYGQLRETMFDIVMHFMAQLDLRQGLSRQEYYQRFFLRELVEEVCGEKAAEAVQYFGEGHLRRILHLILKLYICGSSIYLLREVMRNIYPDSIIYQNNEMAREVLIYVGFKETEEERTKITFLLDTFLPVNFEVFIFWDRHFGIIDVDETMVIDEMVLF